MGTLGSNQNHKSICTQTKNDIIKIEYELRNNTQSQSTDSLFQLITVADKIITATSVNYVCAHACVCVLRAQVPSWRDFRDHLDQREYRACEDTRVIRANPEVSHHCACAVRPHSSPEDTSLMAHKRTHIIPPTTPSPLLSIYR